MIKVQFNRKHDRMQHNIEGFRPEWYFSTMTYSRDIPFWSETLDILLQKTVKYDTVDSDKHFDWGNVSLFCSRAFEMFLKVYVLNTKPYITVRCNTIKVQCSRIQCNIHNATQWNIIQLTTTLIMSRCIGKTGWTVVSLKCFSMCILQIQRMTPQYHTIKSNYSVIIAQYFAIQYNVIQ